MGTVGEETQRFEMLYTRLRTKRVLAKTTDMLQLLLHLSGEGNNNTSKSSIAPNILNSVFASKIMNKLDYNASSATLQQKYVVRDIV